MGLRRASSRAGSSTAMDAPNCWRLLGGHGRAFKNRYCPGLKL